MRHLYPVSCYIFKQGFPRTFAKNWLFMRLESFAACSSATKRALSISSFARVFISVTSMINPNTLFTDGFAPSSNRDFAKSATIRVLYTLSRTVCSDSVTGTSPDRIDWRLLSKAINLSAVFQAKNSHAPTYAPYRITCSSNIKGIQTNKSREFVAAHPLKLDECLPLCHRHFFFIVNRKQADIRMG